MDMVSCSIWINFQFGKKRQHLDGRLVGSFQVSAKLKKKQLKLVNRTFIYFGDLLH